MKIRYMGRGATAAAVLSLFVALGAAACGGKDDNANNSNMGRNTNVPMATATPTATPVSASEDNALKNTVEANLTKAGVTGVTVEVKDGVVTLKGSVPTAKFQDAVKAANDAKPKRVDNQLSKK